MLSLLCNSIQLCPSMGSGSEEAAPLLLPVAAATATAEERCPGCVQERRKASRGGRIPYTELFFVAVTTLASSLPITCLFPFLYFMVRDLQVAQTEEDIGYYAGFLGASYMVGRSFAAIFWGVVADRIGRKPVIVFSILSVVIFNTLFGLSTKYWMALTTRFVLGALNGLLAPIKVNTAWGLGLVVGPALGGYLAQPVEKYPHVFSKESVFGRFPYLLPCLGVSLFAAIVLISCIWLPETIHKHKSPDKDIKRIKELPLQQAYWDSPRKKSLFQNRPWMSTMISYCFFGLHDTAYSEILSLWAVSDRKYGGLSFSSEDIGQVLAVAGASLLAYQLIIYHWVHKFLGPIISLRIASALSILILSTYPFMTYLSGAELSLALYSAAMMKSALAITISTGICLLQNNAVLQEHRGTANGVSTTAIAYSRFLILSLSFSALPISSLFPFLYFMIRDLHVAKRTEDIGFYVGFVGASFMFGRCLTSTVWGIAADRIGRKPVVVFGIFAVVIFNTLFGLSFTYWMAIATRFLLGALNGLLGPIKAYAIEVCRPEHEALALSLVSTAWGIGLIIGPAIGGYLSQPAEKFPNVFSPDSLFARFPYFLPCLCISVFAAVVLIGCIWMPETLHKHKADANRSQTVEALESHLIDPKEKADQNGSLDCKKSLLRNWPLMSSIILYCVFSFHDMAYTEIFSLWAESDRKYGGLSLSSEDVGQVLAITGVSLLVYQLFIYPRINKILCIPILFAYPYMTYLSGPGLTIILNIASVIKNNLGPQDQRGAANGLAMTGMSFFKAVAPAGAGIVFSWAQKRQHASFLPGDQMVFFLLNLFELLGLILTFKPFLAVPEQHDTN
uniref:Major facilitator superfamily (MFS) profile domain-containing protein n=1 Tax=Oryza glumipatula TaxID=40148 RepID=A0A0E0BNJ4_9ORYZ